MKPKRAISPRSALAVGVIAHLDERAEAVGLPTYTDQANRAVRLSLALAEALMDASGANAELLPVVLDENPHAGRASHSLVMLQRAIRRALVDDGLDVDTLCGIVNRRRRIAA